jgi:hypothetical protein
MAKSMASGKKVTRPGPKRPRRFRKVTHSLPESLAEKLDQRNAGSSRSKSRVLAEALAFYFAEQDRRALRAIYEEAASDPQFLEDNAAIQEYFATLDHDLDETG